MFVSWLNTGTLNQPSWERIQESSKPVSGKWKYQTFTPAHEQPFSFFRHGREEKGFQTALPLLWHSWTILVNTWYYFLSNAIPVFFEYLSFYSCLCFLPDMAELESPPGLNVSFLLTWLCRESEEEKVLLHNYYYSVDSSFIHF